MIEINQQTLTVAVVLLAVVSSFIWWRWNRGLIPVRYAIPIGQFRTWFMPKVGDITKEAIGIPAENEAYKYEHVGDYKMTPAETIKMLQKRSDREYETSLLSGLKEDWDGNSEVANIVSYHGGKPFKWLPVWLSNKQRHIFLFEHNGGTRVGAHDEANAYRFDKWKDHLYKGESFDPESGVKAVRGLLDA